MYYKLFITTLLGTLLLPTTQAQPLVTGAEKVAPSPALQNIVNTYVKHFGYETCAFRYANFAGTRFTEAMNYSAEEWYAYHLWLADEITRIFLNTASAEQRNTFEQQVAQEKQLFVSNSILDTDNNVLAFFREDSLAGGPQINLYTQDETGSLALTCIPQP